MKILFPIMAMFYFWGCSVPSENDAIVITNNEIRENNSSSYIKLISLKKTNGIEYEKDGKKEYKLEYKAEIEIIKTCYYSHWGLLSIYEAYPLDFKPFIGKVNELGDLTKPGYRREFELSCTFEKTDNGWRSYQDGQIY